MNVGVANRSGPSARKKDRILFETAFFDGRASTSRNVERSSLHEGDLVAAHDHKTERRPARLRRSRRLVAAAERVNGVGAVDPLGSQNSLVANGDGSRLLAVNAGSDEISVLGVTSRV